MGEGIATARTAFAKKAVSLRRAFVHRMFVPILTTGEISVRLAGETAKTLGDSQLVATDQCMKPMRWEVSKPIFRIEKAEDRKVALGNEERALIAMRRFGIRPNA